jgi:hypothetical protein
MSAETGKEKLVPLPACGLKHRVRLSGYQGYNKYRYLCCDVRVCYFKECEDSTYYCRYNQDQKRD